MNTHSRDWDMCKPYGVSHMGMLIHADCQVGVWMTTMAIDSTTAKRKRLLVRGAASARHHSPNTRIGNPFDRSVNETAVSKLIQYQSLIDVRHSPEGM